MAEMRDVISNHGHIDPDAQATVTDFIDYTEYLASDLERALTLVGKLDHTYEDATDKIHKLLYEYCQLPVGDDKRASVLQAQELRGRISNKVELALNVREASYTEATRLHDDMQRHRNRLASIYSKLLALPKPPSRDVTPQPIQSPQAIRREDGAGDTSRLKLRVDTSRTPGHGSSARRGAPSPGRQKKRIIVPGEVLPPPNPDSPTPSMYDDFSSSESSEEEPTPPLPPQPRVRPPKVEKPKVPKIKRPKSPKARKERAPRPPGQMGTNVHSAVAGISTSNALLLLSPPPPDAKLGGIHAPWMRLTEWEMAKLRKRMKKIAFWAPSDTLIRRVLSDAGRGPDAYHRARVDADEKGEEFIDCDDLANKDKDRDLLPGEIPLDVKTKIFNKGMSLNVQKKKKREKDQAAMVEQSKLQHTNIDLSYLGPKMSTLFSKPGEASPYAASPAAQTGDKIVLNPGKKRKRERKQASPPTEETKANAQLHSEIILASKPPKKRSKPASQPPAVASTSAASTQATPREISPTVSNNANVTSTTTTTTVPLAAPAPSPVKATTPAPPPSSPTGTRRTRPTHVSIKDFEPTTSASTAAAPVTAPIPSRPPSRPTSRRASAGPPVEGINREHLRRKSITPAPAPLAPTTASRLRSRRAAPGQVMSSQDGGAAVSIGKRKNAPRKKSTSNTTGPKKENKKPEEKEATDEEAVDPDEETYCVCGGVSFGTMILCENENVSCPCHFSTVLGFESE